MSKLWETGGERNDSRRESTMSGRDREMQVEAFTVGNDYLLDQELLPYDLKASGIHLRALERAGLVTSEEAETLKKGLDEILDLWKRGEFDILREQEDGHTAIEMWLTDRYGDQGKKIHTGRSRNDQVLTAMRLYEKERLREILDIASGCIRSLLDVAENHQEMPMPGYTHTRKAMLSTVGQWLGGFAELMILQMGAAEGVNHLIDRSPLGTAAGFGTTIDLDRDRESEELGFSQPLACATSAQLSRGWVELQLVQYLSGFSSLLSRLASDIIQFSSEAYGFISIDAYLCTGSSIMPNKKNPDVAELIRARNALMNGYAASLQSQTANLGAGYHRDLQLTKEPVMRAFETVSELLEMMTLLVEGLEFDEEALVAACSSDLLAAEEAYHLVREKGLSFRDAYREVKGRSESRASMTLDDLFASYRQLGSPGNPGLDRLREELDRLTSVQT